MDKPRSERVSVTIWLRMIFDEIFVKLYPLIDWPCNRSSSSTPAQDSSVRQMRLLMPTFAGHLRLVVAYLPIKVMSLKWVR